MAAEVVAAAVGATVAVDIFAAVVVVVLLLYHGLSGSRVVGAYSAAVLQYQSGVSSSGGGVGAVSQSTKGRSQRKNGIMW